MEVIYPCCGGIDVHEEFVVVCLSRVQQGQRHKELRRFATYSADLRALCHWLAEAGCTHVGMWRWKVRASIGVRSMLGW
jgi:transposase